MKRLPLSLMFFVFVLFCTISAFSQQPTATLTGIVTDPNGAVIQGATVTATNKTTNLSRTTTTNDEGVYVISSLPVGSYEVKVSANNFPQTITYPSVNLNVGQTVNLNAELGASGPEVTVEIVDSQIVDTQTSKVDAVINDKEIENLPLNGRNFSRTRASHARKHNRAEL